VQDGNWNGLRRGRAELDLVRHEFSFTWLFSVNHHAVADAQARQLGGPILLNVVSDTTATVTSLFVGSLR